MGLAREGDILLMQGEVPRGTIEAVARAARNAGRRVVLNVAPWLALDHVVLTAAEPLVVHEHEAQLAIAELGLESDDDPKATARDLLEAGGRLANTSQLDVSKHACGPGGWPGCGAW